MTPRELVGAFADHGRRGMNMSCSCRASAVCARIMGSTSTFGAPFYRDRVLGQLARSFETDGWDPRSFVSEAYGPSLTGKNFCSEESNKQHR